MLQVFYVCHNLNACRNFWLKQTRIITTWSMLSHYWNAGYLSSLKLRLLCLKRMWNHIKTDSEYHNSNDDYRDFNGREITVFFLFSHRWSFYLPYLRLLKLHVIRHTWDRILNECRPKNALLNELDGIWSPSVVSWGWLVRFCFLRTLLLSSPSAELAPSRCSRWDDTAFLHRYVISSSV